MACMGSCSNISADFSEVSIITPNMPFKLELTNKHIDLQSELIGLVFSSGIEQKLPLPLIISYNDSHTGIKAPEHPSDSAQPDVGLERPAQLHKF